MQIVSWNGSIAIGVTECDPETMEIPSSALHLRYGSWIMTGSSIVHNGNRIVEVYGEDLGNLKAGDMLGVMRTSNVIHILLIQNFSNLCSLQSIF